MPKLLSTQEVNEIATKMTAEYGLPAPMIKIDSGYNSMSWAVKVEIHRLIRIRVFDERAWPLKNLSQVMRSFWAESYEDALMKLELELSYYNSRAKIAEHFREKYAMLEAGEALDKVLKEEE